MPTTDRRPRARRAQADEPPLRGLALSRAMHEAKGNPQKWADLRPRAIRGMSGTLTREQAARIFDVYGRKPEYMPRLPPFDAQDADESIQP